MRTMRTLSTQQLTQLALHWESFRESQITSGLELGHIHGSAKFSKGSLRGAIVEPYGDGNVQGIKNQVMIVFDQRLRPPAENEGLSDELFGRDSS